MTLRLLHMSDIHFGSEDVAAVRAATAFAHASRFDLLIVSGDVTQLGGRPEFAAAADWLAGMPGPQLATPGNHDTPWYGLIERVVAPFGRYARTIGPPATMSHAGRGLGVYALNSARGWQVRLNWSKGHVSRRQARAAAGALSAMPADAVRIVVCHHPLVEARGEPITSRVRGGDHAARAIVAAGADLVMTGHLHVPFVQPLPFGDEKTYAVGAGTLSLRERGAPASFNVIEIEAGQMTTRAMAWDGRDLVASRTWTAPLRPREVAA